MRDLAFGKTETRYSQLPSAANEIDRFAEIYRNLSVPKRVATSVSIPGKLIPPAKTLADDLRQVVPALTEIMNQVRETRSTVVAIYDGLDRLIEPDRFLAAVEQDFQVLRWLSISLVAAAPLSLLFRTGRQILDRFDRVRHLSAVATGEDGNSFLHEILRRRDEQRLLSDIPAEALCRASGGVLRDLISLARNAGEDAYISGNEDIKDADIDRAIRQLGESYRLGLGHEQIEVLKELARYGRFSSSDPLQIELLVTRRVLEYSSNAYAVHPALLPLLD